MQRARRGFKRRIGVELAGPEGRVQNTSLKRPRRAFVVRGEDRTDVPDGDARTAACAAYAGEVGRANDVAAVAIVRASFDANVARSAVAPGSRPGLALIATPQHRSLASDGVARARRGTADAMQVDQARQDVATPVAPVGGRDDEARLAHSDARVRGPAAHPQH